jgi:hypothetical protein
MLVPGTYDVTAALFNYAITEPYDFRHRAFRFDVEFGEPHEENGVVSLGGEWTGDALGVRP